MWNSVSIIRSVLVSCTQCNDQGKPLVLPQGLWTLTASTVCPEKGLLPTPLQQGKGRGKPTILQLLQPMADYMCKLPLISSHINALATTVEAGFAGWTPSAATVRPSRHQTWSPKPLCSTQPCRKGPFSLVLNPERRHRVYVFSEVWFETRKSQFSSWRCGIGA